jgi:hypothetical protein
MILKNVWEQNDKKKIKYQEEVENWTMETLVIFVFTKYY